MGNRNSGYGGFNWTLRKGVVRGKFLLAGLKSV